MAANRATCHSGVPAALDVGGAKLETPGGSGRKAKASGVLALAGAAGITQIPGFYDVALRDFGLFLAAIALARLASQVRPKSVALDRLGALPRDYRVRPGLCRQPGRRAGQPAAGPRKNAESTRTCWAGRRQGPSTRLLSADTPGMPSAHYRGCLGNEPTTGVAWLGT
jgi:hypothetical protein